MASFGIEILAQKWENVCARRKTRNIFIRLTFTGQSDTGVYCEEIFVRGSLAWNMQYSNVMNLIPPKKQTNISVVAGTFVRRTHERDDATVKYYRPIAIPGCGERTETVP